MVHDVWVEVNLGSLKHNITQVRRSVPETTQVMAVVKGNGFGHGYVEPPRAFVEAGADALAVTRLEEALPIRQADVHAPILLFAPIQPENAEAAIEADLDVTVCSIELAQAISAASQQMGKIGSVWVKVDTGMGRLGLLPPDVPAFLRTIRAMPSIRVAGTYTHFANASEPRLGPTQAQFAVFGDLLASLRKAGIDYGLASAANSAAIVRMPQSHLDMVRPGTLLYGQYPSNHVPHSLDLTPTWKLKARVCHVRELPQGSAVGYGAEFTTRRATRIGIIPIGYADGFTMTPERPIYRQGLLKFAARRARRNLSVEVRGCKAPVLGRVAMQLTVIDVTDIPGVQVGDVATIPAMRIPTSPLVPRVYVDA